MSNSETLQAEIDRLTLEVQALREKQGSQKVSIGNYLLTRLTQMGVKNIFGVPGDFNLGLLDLIEDRPDVNWVGNCNELNAAYAADGYARVKPGSLGVIVTTFGVGELSATNGIAGAFSEMSPVLHIAGVPSTTQMKNRPLLHHTLGDGRFDAYSKAAEQFTVYQAHMSSVDDAATAIDRAIVECVSKTRPVYLTLPTDMVYHEVSSERLNTPLSRRRVINDPKTEEFVLDLIEQRVKEADADVVVLLDACVLRFGIRNEVASFCKATGFPVYAAPMGKSAIDEDWERYGGIYIGSITHPDVKEAVEKAKLILSIGSLKSDFNTGNFSYNIPTRRNIELHSHHTQVQYAMFEGIGFGELLPKLTERLRQFYDTATKLPMQRFAHPVPEEGTQEISQAWLWPRMSAFFKPGDIIVTETGTANFGIIDTPLPPNTMLINQVLWGSIGWSVGAALGAAIAGEEVNMKRTILFVGDGSLQLTVQELSPMIRLGLKPIIFVLNNHGYTIEKMIHGRHRKYNDIADWKWTQLLDVLGDRKTKTSSHKVTTKEEVDALFSKPEFLNPEAITLVELIMNPLDAPRALQMQTEMSRKAKPYGPSSDD